MICLFLILPNANLKFSSFGFFDFLKIFLNSKKLLSFYFSFLSLSPILAIHLNLIHFEFIIFSDSLLVFVVGSYLFSNWCQLCFDLVMVFYTFSHNNC